MMVLFPTLFVLFVYFVPASFLIRPEYFFTFIMVVLAISDKKTPVLREFRKELALISMLAIIAVLSTFVQNLIGNKMIWKDLMILVRYSYYAFAILAGAYLAIKVSRHTNFVRILQVLLILSIIVSIFQYYNILGVNSYSVLIYGQKYETLLTGAYWRRIIGTMGNANYWGLILDFCVIYCSYRVLLKRKLYWLIPTPFLLVAILYTGSRTTIVALILSAPIALYLINKSKKVNIKTAFFVAMIILVALLVKSFVFSNNVDVYEYHNRFSVDNISTLEMRMHHWKGIISGLADNPYQILIGGGASKASIVRYGDNMYIRYLRDFGLFSLVAYLMLLKTMVARTRGALNDERTIDSAAIFLWCLVCFMIFDLAADAWFNVRIAGLLLFLYGYVIMFNFKAKKA